MPVDMKQLIAQATNDLLVNKHVHKLTVKDIVDECHITRQAFYYHFADIPELLSWTLKKESNELMAGLKDQQSGEEMIKYLLMVAINVIPYVHSGMETNYRHEIEELINNQIYSCCKYIAFNNPETTRFNDEDIDFVIRYHEQAVIGYLKGWNEEDSKNVDHIAHLIYRIMSGK
ncbi:MAG: TetR/AcrR family transcriptional regulator [Thomasclavelia sp.]|jgi:AcrR family transcriptional regulator|nr:TetR/AcrR family transcriptional regulator [Thomasclavelia sp.]